MRVKGMLGCSNARKRKFPTQSIKIHVMIWELDDEFQSAQGFSRPRDRIFAIELLL